VIAAAAATAPAAQAATFGDAAGLHIVSVKQPNPRLVTLVATTKALPRPVNIYVLLPPDYDAKPRKRWPVFYLLHGTSGTASDWTVKGAAEKAIGDRELITVMPDIALDNGGGGWCTDWPNGAQTWETFHIGQLIPWVDANLRTIPTRQKRAIAGLSQGGFCSMSYAARHPDLFSTALGYSAAPDIYYDPELRVGAKLIINGTEIGLTRVPPDTFFGSSVTDAINWAAHDPTTLAENLRWTRMYMYWGNGQPGPYDKPGPDVAGAGLIEGAINESNNGFQRRLNSLGIPAYFDAYGAGTHAWPYWTRDLEQSIDKIMSDFAHPEPNPSQFTYRSADDRYGVYGWDVTIHRTAREFSTLAGASCRGFAVSGSGSATVGTPACYKRGSRYLVTMTGPHASSSAVVTIGNDRRLVLDVPLGPANPYQEETAQSEVAGTAVYTTYVKVKGVSSQQRRRPSACSKASRARCSKPSRRRPSSARR
jgi:S-formylglutathione hydrolase FrmB